MRYRTLGWSIFGLALACPAAIWGAGCGGAPVAPTREAAVESTYAGSHKCEATAHTRPFVIEWDATDMSTFESRASKDLVFVRYQGCDLEVLNSCADDAIAGSFGAYRPPAWTSGSVETVDIENTGDLYAKLPLGVATLGGKVERGIKLRMEYYVSGVATATREQVYRESLAKNPACATATHFVYGFNLGAFSIFSEETAKDSAGAEVQGVGVGGESTRKRQSEKLGGELAACKGTTAADTDKCRIPIRLMLKPITPGADPTPPAPPPTDAPFAAGSPLEQAGKLRSSAGEKMQLKDGKGCLADLDRADTIDPDPSRSSHKPKALLHLRATCELIAGDCKSGRQHLREARQVQLPGVPAATIDVMVDNDVQRFCAEAK